MDNLGKMKGELLRATLLHQSEGMVEVVRLAMVLAQMDQLVEFHALVSYRKLGILGTKRDSIQPDTFQLPMEPRKRHQ